MKTNWNYSELAKPYLNRPNYSEDALNALFTKININKNAKVCDVGAGVAHLTIPLLERGYFVDAVEPNNEMRALGKQRTTKYKNASWHEGTGEDTGMKDSGYELVTFGSSFNVTNRELALKETARILGSKGWFACMWNHRDLNDKLQSAVEGIIKKNIPNYDYGSRREDQTDIINKSNLFGQVSFLEGNIMHEVNKTDWVDAWRSHATLARQAGDSFHQIINEIESFVNSYDGNKSIMIPYTTRIWFAQKNK